MRALFAALDLCSLVALALFVGSLLMWAELLGQVGR